MSGISFKTMTSGPHFPLLRPRRLRSTPALRKLVQENSLSAGNLILPAFVRNGKGLRQPINSMPGVAQVSPDELLHDATAAFKAGVPGVILFGIPDAKDEKASGAYDSKGAVQESVRLLKRELPE